MDFDTIAILAGLLIAVVVIGAIISVLTLFYHIMRVLWRVFTAPVRALWRMI